MKTVIRLAGAVALAAGVFWALGRETRETAASIPAEIVEAAGDVGEADLWLAPGVDPVEPSTAARGVEALSAGEPERAVALLTSVVDPHLKPYAQLHLARAYLELKQPDEAARALRAVVDARPDGFVGEIGRWLLADALEATERWSDALAVWRELEQLPLRSSNHVAAELRRAIAAEKAGERELARDAYARVYYEWPASAEASDAEAALRRLPSVPADPARELARADRLYDARRWADAGRAYEQVAARVDAAERDRVDLRLGLIDVQLGRYTQGLARLSAYLKQPRAARRDEAAFGMLAAWRGLGRADYPARVERFVAEYPDSPLAETALNELGTHLIVTDRDGEAARVFARMYEQFPDGRFADRAAWRAGWWAYRHDDYRGTIRYFESAALRMRRADYRPAWLYWTARACEALGEQDSARIWYLRTIADYRNSYYGRRAAEAFRALAGRDPDPAEVAAYRDPERAVRPGTPPAGTERVRALLEASLWGDAVSELLLLQPSRGANPMVEATIAHALNRNGELRPAITAMRRAYPQFMSDGGEKLPRRILEVIFPVAHVETLARYAAARELDVHLLTALVAQESTFQADVRSSANAIGLMQLLPATGQRYATRLGIRGFTPALLTDPETNVRLGTAYLADLLRRYGGNEAAALAAYNAGENRVDRWRRERPGVPTDEFIDDIPYPETQNYVKRILGTADDYRILYGAALARGAAR